MSDYSAFYAVPYTLEFINMILGVSIFAICFCRVVASSRNVLGRVRLKYILIGPAAIAVALNPLWGVMHITYADTFFMGAVLVGLMSETYQWRHGPPASVRCDAMSGEMKASFTASLLHRIKVLFGPHHE